MKAFSKLGLISLTLLWATVSAVPTLQERAEQIEWVIGQPVQTSSGLLLGQPAKGAPNVSEYLGIPYAQPPVGDLRFTAPKKFEGTGNITARFFGYDCPSNSFNLQQFISKLTPDQLEQLLSNLNLPVAYNLLAAYGQLGNVYSEDCLTLNVWTKPQTGEKKKAVLVFIYGGGFESGATNNPFYNGRAFADNQDVVLVTLNYRTNVFGFPGVPGLEDVPQNPGLLDQRLALEWVRDNIEAFGGDKSRVTIFGQSAGGASVDLYSYAYTKDPIVHALIAQSGTATSFFSPPPPNNTVAWYNASKILGCGDASVGAKASLDCIRKISTKDLLNATNVEDPIQSVLGNFGPTADGKIVFSDYDERGSRGDFIRKPYLVGNNENEAGLFRLFAFTANRTFTDLEWCLFNADIFTCPAAKAAKYRTLSGLDTHRYRYFGEFYNLRLTNTPNSGAWHGSELPILFQSAEESSGVPNTPEENSISNYLQGAWAAFAKDPEHAFSKAPYKLPNYNPLSRSLIQFAKNNATEPSFAFPITTDSFCGILDFVDALLPGGIVGALKGGISSEQLLAMIAGAAEKSDNEDVKKLSWTLTAGGGNLAAGQSCPF